MTIKNDNAKTAESSATFSIISENISQTTSIT